MNAYRHVQKEKEVGTGGVRMQLMTPAVHPEGF